jgi:predicted nucleotidyltransferase
VDLLIAKTPFEEQVLRRAVRIEIGPRAVPIASPEDLIVYKLLADRPRDREDIRAVLRTQARAGRSLDWRHVGQWAAFWRITDRLQRLRSQITDEP